MRKTTLKIGASTLCLFQEPFDDLLRSLPATGISLWEIADDGLHGLNRTRVEKLNEIRESYGFVFNVHTPWTAVNISALHPNVREKVQQTVMDSIGFAHDLGSDFVVIHPGRSSYFVESAGDLCWRYTAEFIERAAIFCADHGITPLIENIFPPYFLFYDEKQIEEYFRGEAPRNLRLACDFAHANVTGNLLPLVENVVDYLSYVHLSGNHGERDEHLVLGEGNVKWKEGLTILFKAGFDGPMIVENRSLDDAHKSLDRLKMFMDSLGVR